MSLGLVIWVLALLGGLGDETRPLSFRSHPLSRIFIYLIRIVAAR